MIAAEAPSNIALIKYMGKKLDKGNQPTNSSFSWTLPHLRSRVELVEHQDASDRWEPLERSGFLPIQLSAFSIDRYLSFFSVLKNELGIQGHFLVRSANNFASDCGIASSASSFAALTEATVRLSKKDLALAEMAELSRRGSGSSGRSFFEKYGVWDHDGFFEAQGPELLHLVVVATKDKKGVSSSEAHRRVSSSLLFDGRPERAEQRLKSLIRSFETQDWQESFEICWAEFWDMHALFETSRPNFGYLNSAALEILSRARLLWQKEKDGPLVTMDAGPNVHLLFRLDQKDLKNRIQQEWSDLGFIVGSD